MKARTPEAKSGRREILDYDAQDTSALIDRGRPLALADLGLELPKVLPTQVVFIRLLSQLLNRIKAVASERDVPYQALIKLMLADPLEKRRVA